MKSKRLLLVLFISLLPLLAAGCGGGDADPEPVAVSAGDAGHGQELYESVCIACHGPGGAGIENLGKPFVRSAFLAGKDDAELLAFVKVGRPSSDPENTTGVDMLPKGGNPALSDDDILDIIAYLRTLQ